MAFDFARTLVPAFAAATALALSACGGNSGAADDRSTFEREGDYARGSVDAPVVMIEYASTACGGCAAFHAGVYPTLNQYIEDGTLRLVFREMLTGSAELALAGFMLARCSGEERYFDVIDVLFEQQQAIFMAAQRGQARQQFQTIARSAGLSDEEFRACMSDESAVEAINAANQQAARDGINATPSFIINGVNVQANRAPDGSGVIYFAGDTPIEDEEGTVPAQFTGDSFSRIIEYFRSRAEE
ncbi:MAG: Periplasmic thiol:disulfide interchange protein DsbA [Oceanicaulis sp. HLUCCA04]|nr:MAG: Periplasmic thiol:disulfide interchange protein DsbA [Oceanicaulis sp. HLUCCA04]